MEDQEDKKIDLKRHQNHHFISPKFIIRFILIVGAGAFLMYQFMSVLNSKSEAKKTNKEIEKDTTSIPIELN